MTVSEGIVDWNALCLNDGVHLVASVIRRHLQVRLFALALDGELTDLTPEVESVETIFDHFALTQGRWGSEGEAVTMAETVHAWAEALSEAAKAKPMDPGDVIHVDTAPGFRAHIAPVYHEGALLGGLVSAGFVAAERASQAVEAIRAVLPQHLVEAIRLAEVGPNISQLHREERRWLDRLTTAIAEHFEEELERRAPELIEESATRFSKMIGQSQSMKRLFRDIQKVARTNSTILVTGENGTGKELVAHAIHERSRRRNQPFIAVNCAAIPGELIASELFGHVKGAFSGAHRDRKGLFEAAHGGTLLLDEIGDMEHSLQTKLLRVLQEGTILRVGDSEVRRVDVRVICATNCDLEEMVRKGEFRRDLYYRIRVINLSIPPLREREEDVALLARHFLSAAARRHGKGKKELSEECLRQLTFYDWPGNVRELENELERLVIMSGDDKIIDERWLSPQIAQAPEPEPTIGFEGFELPEAIEYIERKMILETLQRTGWNKSQTARDLGVSRRNLIRKVARYELEAGRSDD